LEAAPGFHAAIFFSHDFLSRHAGRTEVKEELLVACVEVKKRDKQKPKTKEKQPTTTRTATTPRTAQ